MAGHVKCVFYWRSIMYLFLAANYPGIPLFGRFPSFLTIMRRYAGLEGKERKQ